MEKEKLINEIGHTIESIKTHVNRIKSDTYKVHKVDVDLLIEKTRQMYDQLINLDGMQKPFEKKATAEVEKKMEVIPSDKVPEQEMPEKETEDMPEEMFNPEEQEVETVIEIIKKEEPADEIQKQVEPEKHEQVTEKEEQKTIEKEVHVKSTIDLFSTASEPTLGDRLKSTEQPSVADKITKNTINELREAIGINEKFLFINELFNGDMSRYNKIIDELDQLTTLEGVNTFMLELKIQSQWQDDSPALLKLTELLQRKFIK